ncbi:protein-disulfide reductase DsbD [Hydrogenimonas sp. SS33]|uniref:protein-disulfide reductase DsbD n=1 Tax=Hydrogenimonas leucolamina TaxID=2954236 RepID=UPI00336BF8AD
MKKWWMLLLLPLTLFAGFMTVDEAFKPSVTLKNGTFHVVVDIADHIHLTKAALSFGVEPKEKAALGAYTLPPAQKDEFGDEVYTGRFKVDIPLVKKEPSLKKVTFVLKYQGCSDRGICYPPVVKRYDFPLVTAASASVEKPAASKSAFKPETGKPAAPPLSEEESIATTLKNKSFGFVLFTFFGFGLLLALTPCIFPMIPILSSIIVAQGERMNAKKGFLLSLVYVLSMAATYTIAGVLAGLFGANIQAALQNPWVITLFALLFVALAFSMFGFYELQLPASWQSRLSRTSDEAGRKGGVAGVAVMGFLSALIVGPCVAPPLAGALIYIGQTGDALLGGAALFVMSLGMGAPLLLIGIGAGRFMPRPGGWMTTVSKVFGVVMLGVAIWMLSRILPASVTMLLWSLLFVVSAVYLGAFEALTGPKGWNALFKGLGLFLFVYGIVLMVGAFTGSGNPADPLKVFKNRGVSQSSAPKLQFERVTSLDTLLDRIRKSEKPVMVDFRADWCVSCKELEENTFSDPKVAAVLSGWRLLQVDVTKNSPEEKKMMAHFGIFGPPAVLFFKNGEEVKAARISGYKSPEVFLEILKRVRL